VEEALDVEGEGHQVNDGGNHGKKERRAHPVPPLLGLHEPEAVSKQKNRGKSTCRWTLRPEIRLRGDCHLFKAKPQQSELFHVFGQIFG
ncbi:MAG: hypothetical protein AAB886_02045, partial [Patescibacteria group bacterium]